MIRYALRCADGHSFDSWFASSAEFDRLQRGRPARLRGLRRAGRREGSDGAAGAGPGGGRRPRCSAPASPAEQALADLRRRIEAVSENVGRDFAAEARRIHEGEAPARPIIGEARPAEARALIEDGIPVAPLPWSSRKAN